VKKYKPALYRSPVKLAEKKCGKVSINHRIMPAGETIPVVGMRQAITRGLRPAVVRLKESLTIHRLVHSKHGVWMTDMPEELNQIGEMLHTVQPKGRVLVGGLGLGILASTLANRPDVDDVTVVEIDKDVIKLCDSGEGYVVVHDDVQRYLHRHEKPFDYYLLDTWQMTNEGTWWRNVMPMRRTIRKRWGTGPIIHCWAEDIMVGQVLRTLMSGQPHWHYEHLPLPMGKRTALDFVNNVGTQKWEERYGALVPNFAEEDQCALR
jgi:hypothetical protein